MLKAIQIKINFYTVLNLKHIILDDDIKKG